MIARYTGLFIAIAAPDLPLAPWHPAQSSPYRVAKSVTLVGRSGRSACVGRPGSESQPAIRIVASDALARSDLKLRALNLMLVLALFDEARRLDAGANGEREMLQGMYALCLVDYETRDRAERNLAQNEPSPFDARVEQGLITRSDDHSRPVHSSGATIAAHSAG